MTRTSGPNTYRSVYTIPRVQGPASWPLCVWLSLLAALVACDRTPAQTSTSPAPPASPLPSVSSSAQRWVRHGTANWLTCTLNLNAVELQLVGQAPNDPFTLAAVKPFVAAQNREWILATNAGIFDPARRPVGLHVQQGKEFAPLSTRDGEGNFYLKPNGVFWIDATGAHIASTESYAPRGSVLLATQSGPLLVAHKNIHPAFVPSSTSLRTRSGVGVDTHGNIVFVLSDERITFHSMATLFRDVLDCPDALYLDGEISAIASPELPPPSPHDYGGILIAMKRSHTPASK